MAMVIEGPPFRGFKGHIHKNITMATSRGSDMNSTQEGEDVEEGRSLSRTSDESSRPMSALARGVQITEFAESRVNPTPLLLEESDILLEQYLSPGKLQLLTGVDNLNTVECLELKVDSRETSLGNFGSLLPNLRELKLSGSCISCVRDLGSSLRNLRILWLTRCGLEELDGISSMLQLVELYLEYNEISDLSPLSMLEQLEILDLEGNNIEDITQVQYLSLCPKLRRLALDGNPICVYPSPTQVEEDPNYNYRATVKSLLPDLLVLDDERMDADVAATSSPHSPTGEATGRHHNVFDEDWAYLEELQQDAFLQQEFTSAPQDTGAPLEGDRPPTGALRPATGYRPGSALRPSSGFRPLSASRRRPNTMSPGTPASQQAHSASTRAVATSEGIESTSELTMGTVICGNPSKALRQRRQGGPGSKDEIKKGLSRLMQKGAVFTHSEGAEDEPIPAEAEMNSIIEELQSWKVDHDRRMKEILKTKEAQILVVDHDEAEEVLTSDDEDDEGFVTRSMQHRPPSATQQQRHTVDLRLKRKPAGAVATKDDSKRPSVSDSNSSVREKSHASQSSARRSSRDQELVSEQAASWHHHSSMSSDKLNSSWDENDNSDGETTRPFKRGSSPALDKHAALISRPPSSSSSTKYRSQNGSGEPATSRSPEGEGQGSELMRRPGSRGAELGPLRAPSPTSAQIINSLRQRQQQQSPNSPPTSPRRRKLRVGPTGLPLSSQSQQPVIRGSLVPPPSRGGSSTPLLGTPGLGSASGSRSGVALLPSQPCIARQLPEPPSQRPRPS